MQAAAMQDHLRDRMVEVTPEEFEVLCKMVLVRRLDTWSLQVTAFQQDEGIDIEGVIDEGIVRAFLGVQVKRYSEGNTVSQPSIHQFRGALTQGDHQVGTYITSSSFTAPAREAANKLQICLVDGETLASVMVENGIGIQSANGSYEVQTEFWRAFEEPTEDDRIPANEVPLADTIEALRLYLEAIAETDGSESEMHRYVSENFEIEYTERHANMNARAGWLLGFVHRETPTEVNGREVQRWGLTREGSKYLALTDNGDRERARSHLVSAVRGVEIIQRLNAALDSEEELTLDELRGILDSETRISGASIERRASTVAKWFTMLPEVEERPHGRSKKYVRV
jgi:restriction system protein